MKIRYRLANKNHYLVYSEFSDFSERAYAPDICKDGVLAALDSDICPNDIELELSAEPKTGFTEAYVNFETYLPELVLSHCEITLSLFQAQFLRRHYLERRFWFRITTLS